MQITYSIKREACQKINKVHSANRIESHKGTGFSGIGGNFPSEKFKMSKIISLLKKNHVCKSEKGKHGEEKK